MSTLTSRRSFTRANKKVNQVKKKSHQEERRWARAQKLEKEGKLPTITTTVRSKQTRRYVFGYTFSVQDNPSHELSNREENMSNSPPPCIFTP